MMHPKTRAPGNTPGTLAAVVIGALVLVPCVASAQGGTSPMTPGVGSSQSGSAIDSTQGADVSRPRSSPDDRRHFDAPFTGQPSGLGEAGSGQSQSTMERSSGQHPDLSQRELQEGKTAQALEQQLHTRDNPGEQESSSY